MVIYDSRKSGQSKSDVRGYGEPIRDWEGTLVIHKGLSVVLHGHLLSVAKDTKHCRALIQLTPIGVGKALTAEEVTEVREAANILAGRAQRTFGFQWKVEVKLELPSD